MSAAWKKYPGRTEPGIFTPDLLAGYGYANLPLDTGSLGFQASTDYSYPPFAMCRHKFQYR